MFFREGKLRRGKPGKGESERANLEFDDKNFYWLFVGKVDPAKKKIKGAKNLKKVKGAKKTTKVRQKDLVRMCKRKAEAQFRKCAKAPPEAMSVVIS